VKEEGEGMKFGYHVLLRIGNHINLWLVIDRLILTYCH